MFHCTHHRTIVQQNSVHSCDTCRIKYEHCRDGKMRRVTLPATCHERKSNENAFLSFAKRLIGMELTRAGFPTSFFEPFNWLLKQAELLEDIDKLRKIQKIHSPVERMSMITGIFISFMQQFLNNDRIMSINPILGETYELSRPDLGFRMVTEKVSHHPPIFAYYAESVDIQGKPDNVYRVFGDGTVQASFSGISIEAQPTGFTTIELLELGESYTHVLNCDFRVYVNNLLRGLRRFSNRANGSVLTYCHDMNSDSKQEILRSEIKCYPPTKGFSIFGGYDETNDPSYCDGYTMNCSGEKLTAFYGKYNQELFTIPVSTWEKVGGWKKALNAHKKKEDAHPHSKKNSRKHHPHTKIDHSNYVTYIAPGVSKFDFKLEGQKLVWRKDTLAATYYDDYYGLNKYCIQINEPDPDANLPPTDSRNRQDIRILETGDMDAAHKEKFRLEEKQRYDLKVRLARANLKSGDTDPWVPMWFRKRPHPYLKDRRVVWIFTGKYYKRDWSECPDLGFVPPKSEI